VGPRSGSKTGPETGLPGIARALLIYVGLAVVPMVVGVVVALSTGSAVSAGDDTPPGDPAGEIPSASRLLLAIAFVCMATVAGGWLAKWLRQPQAVGQMIVGLAIGPSLLGRLAPGFESWLFPVGTAQILALFGGIGAIFFIFLVGLDFSLAELRRSGMSTVVLGQATMAIPFLTGAVLAVGLTALGEAPPDNGMAFNMFIAVAMSVTALPVLAHILRERGLDQSPVGAFGIASAAICGATAWCFLAVTLAIASHRSVSGALLATFVVALFALAMWFVARPLLARLDERGEGGSAIPLLALLGMLLAALATDWLGAHAIFGAFLAGLIFPRSAGYRTINFKIEGLVEWFLLPMFFVSVGLQTKIDLIGSPRDLLIFLLVLATAIASKSLATVLVARLLGIGWRSSSLLAAMMNCRGITELIVLNIGLHAGILNQKLFTILTLMTILTTMITGPALDLINRLNGRG
jgi:Kef-type K+ transport system membrane component KefB